MEEEIEVDYSPDDGDLSDQLIGGHRHSAIDTLMTGSFVQKRKLQEHKQVPMLRRTSILTFMMHKGRKGPCSKQDMQL